MPSWPMPATFWHCALVRVASVAMTPMVVASTGCGAAARRRPRRARSRAAPHVRLGRGCRAWANSPPRPNRAAYSSPVSGSTAEPTGVDHDQRRDRRAVVEHRTGRADPALEPPGAGARARADAAPWRHGASGAGRRQGGR